MTRFVDKNELKTIDLGDGEYVKIPAKISYGDSVDFAKGNDGKNDIDIAKTLAVKFIKEWNLKDGNGNIPEVNEENILKLDTETILFIIPEVLKLINPEQSKKK